MSLDWLRSEELGDLKSEIVERSSGFPTSEEPALIGVSWG